MIGQIDKNYIKRRPSKIWARFLSYFLFEGRPITTKGRWINRLVFIFLRICSTVPKYKEVVNPVFIVGTGRSGTTILGIILSIHKDLSFLNEPKALWHQVYKYEDVIGNYKINDSSYILSADDANKEVIRKANNIYSNYLGLTIGKKVVDKYPEMIFRYDFLKKIFPDLKFLFLAREGIDTLQSIDNWSMRLGERNDGDLHDWWGVNDRKWKYLCSQVVSKSNLLSIHADHIGNISDHKNRAAVEWILTMEKGFSLLQKNDNSIELVRYEDLLVDHQKVLDDICKFIKIESDPIMISYANETLGKQKPKKSVKIDPVLIEPFNIIAEKFQFQKIE